MCVRCTKLRSWALSYPWRRSPTNVQMPSPLGTCTLVVHARSRELSLFSVHSALRCGVSSLSSFLQCRLTQPSIHENCNAALAYLLAMEAEQELRPRGSGPGLEHFDHLHKPYSGLDWCILPLRRYMPRQHEKFHPEFLGTNACYGGALDSFAVCHTFILHQKLRRSGTLSSKRFDSVSLPIRRDRRGFSSPSPQGGPTVTVKRGTARNTNAVAFDTSHILYRVGCDIFRGFVCLSRRA